MCCNCRFRYGAAADSETELKTVVNNNCESWTLKTKTENNCLSVTCEIDFKCSDTTTFPCRQPRNIYSYLMFPELTCVRAVHRLFGNFSTSNWQISVVCGCACIDSSSIRASCAISPRRTTGSPPLKWVLSKRDRVLLAPTVDAYRRKLKPSSPHNQLEPRQ